MKNKKLTSLVLALAMSMTSAASVFAEDETDTETDVDAGVVDYSDTEKPEIPANTLIDNVLYEGKIYGYQSEWNSANIFSGSDYTNRAREYTWKKDGGTFWKIYPIGFNATSYKDGATFAYEAGKSYVLSAMVTDSSTADGLAPIEFTSALMYTNKAGTTNQYVYSLETQAGNDYTLTKDWTKYAATILVPEDYESGVTLFTGTRESFEGSVDQHKFKIYGVYLCEEIAYDIEFTGRTLVNANSPTVIDADLVNQGGTVGNLSQEGFEFVAVNSGRTAIAEGITLTNDSTDSSKVTVSVDETVEAGKYIILAENSGIRKGFEIEVVEDFADDLPATTPQNIIPSGANATGTGLGANEGGWQESVIDGGYEGKGLKFVATEDKAAETGAHWKTRKLYIKTSGDLLEGDTYLVSSMVKDLTEDESLPSVKYTMTVGRTGFTNEYSEGTSLELTDSWQEYYATFTVPAGGLSSPDVFFGYPTWENSVTDQAYIVDNFYIAKEAACDIEIEGDGIISTGVAADYSAEVKNQLGKAFTQGQDIEWLVTDKERTTVQTGFEITGENGNIEVLADDTVVSGTYSLVAISNGIIKGFDITVLSNFQDTEVEMPANMIVDPDNINHLLHSNYAKVTSSYASGDHFTWTEQAAAAETYWGVGSTMLQLNAQYSDLTKRFEKGKRYVISVRLKNANPDAGETVEFAYGLNYLKEGTINVTSTEYQTYTSAFTASLDTGNLALGFDTKVDRSAYTELASVAMDISNGGSLYVAEEQAYAINITGDNRIDVGEETVISAELLNQIGLKGGLSQDFTWMVLNADRTAKSDGLTVSENEDGTVTVTATADGTYTLLAISEEEVFLKGYTITVKEESIVDAIVSNATEMNALATAKKGDGSYSVAFGLDIKSLYSTTSKLYMVIGEKVYATDMFGENSIIDWDFGLTTTKNEQGEQEIMFAIWIDGVGEEYIVTDESGNITPNFKLYYK